jgi:hypothetical protein
LAAGDRDNQTSSRAGGQDPLRRWAKATPWVFVVALLVSLLSHVVSLEGLHDTPRAKPRTSRRR